MNGRRPGTHVLARNLSAALVSLRAQRTLLVILKLQGPSTTKQLAGWCSSSDGVMAREAQVLSLKSLQRHLTALRKTGILKTFPIGKGEMLWALPSQPKPHVMPERRATPRATAERRAPASCSWWIGATRDQFGETLKRRWS